MSKQNEVYVLVALRRKKDLAGYKKGSVNCHRVVVYDSIVEAMTLLVQKISHEPGTWRIYRSVNKRSLYKAKRILTDMLIDDFGNEQSNRELMNIESVWKSALMQQCSAAENKWLIDIDSKDSDLMKAIVLYFSKYNVETFEQSETPNGFHIVTNRFDRRDFSNPLVEIKKDALLFLNIVEVKEK